MGNGQLSKAKRIKESHSEKSPEALSLIMLRFDWADIKINFPPLKTEPKFIEYNCLEGFIFSYCSFDNYYYRNTKSYNWLHTICEIF